MGGAGVVSTQESEYEEEKVFRPTSPSKASQSGCGVLDEFGIFASLAVFPLASVEPFTVTAAGSNGCDVYYAEGPDILGLPLKLLKALRTHLMKDLVARLKRIPLVEQDFSNTAAGGSTLQSPESTTLNRTASSPVFPTMR